LRIALLGIALGQPLENADIPLSEAVHYFRRELEAFVQNTRGLYRPEAWRNDKYIKACGQLLAKRLSLLAAQRGKFWIKRSKVSMFGISPGFHHAARCINA
jgi:hypothetical protein